MEPVWSCFSKSQFLDLHPIFQPVFREFANYIDTANHFGELNSKIAQYLQNDAHHEILTHDLILPGFFELVDVHGGKQFTHTLLSFVGLLRLPEYIHLSVSEKLIVEEIVLLHDVGKIEIATRDVFHPIRSFQLYLQAKIEPDTKSNRLVDQVIKKELDIYNIADVDYIYNQLFGIFDRKEHIEISLQILLHQVFGSLKDWTSESALGRNSLELYGKYISLKLMKIVYIADSNGWNFYDLQLNAKYTDEIRNFFNIDKMI